MEVVKKFPHFFFTFFFILKFVHDVIVIDCIVDCIVYCISNLKEGGWKLKSSEEGRCQFRRVAAKNRRGAQRHAMSLWMKPCKCSVYCPP